MKTAVTGGSGAIGSYVCKEMLNAGHTVVSVDQLPPPKGEVGFSKVDLCDLEATYAALEGFDQVIHLAAIPHPFNDPPNSVMGVNMTIAFNVFEAARRGGISRVIYGCSESSTGFGIHEVNLKPLYIPIDEQHPCWPHEAYSLSKYFGEQIGLKYAQVFELEIVSLRYAWVWLKRDEDMIKSIVVVSREGESRHVSTPRSSNPPAESRMNTFDKKNWLGAYIAVRDVAKAFLAACEFSFTSQSPRFEAFFLTAKNTFHPIPTLDVLRELYGELPEIRDKAYFEDNPYASVFDIRKAERQIAWTPQFDWHGFENWEL